VPSRRQRLATYKSGFEEIVEVTEYDFVLREQLSEFFRDPTKKKSVRRAVRISSATVWMARDELFDDIEVDFVGVDLLIELWWKLGCLHQLLVSRARHFDERRTQSWWLLTSWSMAEFLQQNAGKPRVFKERVKVKKP